MDVADTVPDDEDGPNADVPAGAGAVTAFDAFVRRRWTASRNKRSKIGTGAMGHQK